MTDEIKILVKFAEGKLSAKEFEQEIYSNKNLEVLLSDESISWKGTYLSDSNPYRFLAEQNYDSADGRMNAEGSVILFLKKLNIKVNSTEKYAKEYSLMLTTAPKYLDINPNYFEKFILPTDLSLSKAEQKLMIKKTIDQLFKFQTKPPKWIQNPNWLIRNDKPLYFLGQIEIKNAAEFHDNGNVYVFLDPETGITETVTQWY